ncbi:hypothetical protein PM082_015214 [Marasmius tenuissimus]|nr:hypothetical protein PM082_015214 [Marasmius tenuissimus]
MNSAIIRCLTHSAPSSRSSSSSSILSPDSTSGSSTVSLSLRGPMTNVTSPAIPHGPVVPNTCPNGRPPTRPKSRSFSERRGYDLAIPIPAPAIVPASFRYVTGPEREAESKLRIQKKNRN